MSIQSLQRAASTLLGSCAVLLVALLVAPVAHASFLSGDAMAKAANVLAIVVIVIVPIAVIVLFWLVHVLPEKIAHKRHHPQKDAIQVLCLLSLVFGGMLWPLAWLWAYTKPVLYKMAYGTDTVGGHVAEPGTPVAAQPLQQEFSAVRAELDRLAARSDASGELQALRDRLAALEPRLEGHTGGAR